MCELEGLIPDQRNSQVCTCNALKTRRPWSYSVLCN